MQLFTRLSLLLLLLLCSCSLTPKRKEVRVGVDPSWYPLQIIDREQNITAFSTELLSAIGQLEKIPFVKVTVSWDNLMLGLQKKEYGAILSSMPPYLFNQKQFEFSDPYLALGPVLVTLQNSSIHTVQQLAGKTVALIANSGNAFLLDGTPNVVMREYETAPQALNALFHQSVDAVILDVLTAASYCQDIYQGQLKVATPPLTDQALRLIAPQGKVPETLEAFNRGLAKLRKSGEYTRLLKKWGLAESP